jgi:hypothetical protein
MSFVPTSHAMPLPVFFEVDVAFAVVFGVFVVALLSLAVIVIVWAIRSDREGRIAWRQRQQNKAAAEDEVPPPPRP